jgi:serine/threonine protein kinase
VVQTHDQGFMSDGTPYIVMELLEGESLADRLQRDGSIGLPETGQIVLQVSKALSRAHGLDIVHRDVKPENIFLCRGDEGLAVKVLDFGIARQTRLPRGSWDDQGTLAGTPQYLSPELFKEYEDLDGHADLWALAVVAYRCLTGRLPFTGQTLGWLSLSVLSGEHERPSSIRGDVPAAVDAWFARAFARDKATRFSSAKEMAVAFMSLIPATEQRVGDSWPAPTMGGQSDPRLGADTFTPTRLAPRRWTAPALGGVVLGIAVASLAAFFVLRGSEATSETPTVAAQTTESATTAAGAAEDAGDEGGTTSTEAASSATTASATASAEPPARPYWRPRPRPDATEDSAESPARALPSPTPKRPTRGSEDYGF